MSAGTTVSVGIGSFDSYVENALDDDQIFNKDRHAHTCWKGIFEHYPIKNESTQLDISIKSYAFPKMTDLFYDYFLVTNFHKPLEKCSKYHPSMRMCQVLTLMIFVFHYI